MPKGYNHFYFIPSPQACGLKLFSIHQGNDSPSELNKIFLLRRKSSKETSELIGESDIVAADRKEPIKGNVKGIPNYQSRAIQLQIALYFSFVGQRVFWDLTGL